MNNEQTERWHNPPKITHGIPGDLIVSRPPNYWKRITIALGLALATLLTMLPGLLF